MLHQGAVNYGQILFWESFIVIQPCSLLYVLSVAALAITTVELSSCERDWLPPCTPGCTDSAILPLLRLVSVLALIVVGIVLMCAQVTSLLGHPREQCHVQRWQEHHLSLEKPRVFCFFSLFDGELVYSGGVEGHGEASRGRGGGQLGAAWQWGGWHRKPGSGCASSPFTLLSSAPSPAQ